MPTNDDLRRISPWLGDTRPKNKGGKAASRTLTSLVNECKRYRDDMRAFSEAASTTATEIRATGDRATLTCILSASVGVIFNILTIIFLCLLVILIRPETRAAGRACRV